ncbi:hypothetical protein ACFCWL_00005, partial [Streptomyces sp. NPDC056387]
MAPLPPDTLPSLARCIAGRGSVDPHAAVWRTLCGRYLESLPWNEPACVQVTLHDQDDDPFGLWMFRDGVLAWVGERTGTRRSTYRTRGCPGDPAQAGGGHLLKAPLAGPARAGLVSS